MFDRFNNLRFEDIRYNLTPNNENSGGWVIIWGVIQGK